MDVGGTGVLEPQMSASNSSTIHYMKYMLDLFFAYFNQHSEGTFFVQGLLINNCDLKQKEFFFMENCIMM